MKSCQLLTQNYERSYYQKLSFQDKMEIYVHRIICKKCKKYISDSKTLEKLIARHAQEKYNIAEVFSKVEKDDMKNKLRF